ncbi:MAG: hypothetical protein PHC54_06775 [Candidatus Omnitrophica bacterium]|nr:hypothetical protein [Candidatus Omnitrophota bacterium]MDD5593072.1 hypothetical protein [Candidatus Omnitrophota bacterium]
MHRKNLFLTATVILSCLLLSACLRTQVRATTPAPEHNLIFFYTPSCNECIEAKNKLIPAIEKYFKNVVRVEYKDTDDIENYKLLLSLKEKYNNTLELTLPVFYFEGYLLNGKTGTEANLKRILTQSLGEGYYQEKALVESDLARILKSFGVVGIVTAGLGDGINPCAFTVIIFFISYLALQGYKKKELAAIGLSFISAVFLVYLLIGLGLFNIIYSLEKFSLARRVFNISIGILSVTLGTVSIYDILKFKKTRRTDDLVLQLPPAVKNRIHSIISLYYRKPKDNKKQAQEAHFFRLVISAFVTGFIVSFLELVCTGQLYLPTIKFALKISSVRFQALAYLLLYNLMFIAPLLLIFILALFGVSSEQFSKIAKKHLLGTKLILAVIFFTLGLFLLWRP